MQCTNNSQINKYFLTEYLDNIQKYDLDDDEIDIIKFIIENGIIFIGREQSENFVKVSFEPIKNGCYRNAQKLVMEEKLRYFEGYVTAETEKIPPFRHAWNVSSCDKVVDISLEILEYSLGKNLRQGLAYHGIEIPNEFVMIEILKERAHVSVIRNYIRYLRSNTKT